MRSSSTTATIPLRQEVEACSPALAVLDVVVAEEAEVAESSRDSIFVVEPWAEIFRRRVFEAAAQVYARPLERAAGAVALMLKSLDRTSRGGCHPIVAGWVRRRRTGSGTALPRRRADHGPNPDRTPSARVQREVISSWTGLATSTYISACCGRTWKTRRRRKDIAGPLQPIDDYGIRTMTSHRVVRSNPGPPSQLSIPGPPARLSSPSWPKSQSFPVPTSTGSNGNRASP